MATLIDELWSLSDGAHRYTKCAGYRIGVTRARDIRGEVDGFHLMVWPEGNVRFVARRLWMSELTGKDSDALSAVVSEEGKRGERLGLWEAV